MVRKRQPIQTAKGQQYGEAQAQEQAQQAMPLPKIEKPTPQRLQKNRKKPGDINAFGPTTRPLEAITAQPTPEEEFNVPLPYERSRQLGNLLPALYAASASAFSDNSYDEIILNIENFVPTKYDGTVYG